jgi:cell division transport system ATP-binding protein
MIYFENVTKTYDDDTVALSDINLKIAPHEFVSVVGHSGAGKSTLLKLLLAEELPTEGSVFFESEDIHLLKPSEITRLRQKVGSIFQDFRLIPNKTVYENVAFAMEVSGRTDEEIAEDVPYVLQLVDLERKAFNFPAELSGGEKQRVAIARALVNQPDVLIADEPTGNLDPANTYDIVQILKKINDLGTTIVLTTHNKGIVDELGRRVITLENGRIVNDDPTGKYSF